MPDFQRFTYHCHTNFSDGINTIEEMLIQAKSLGFKEIGISDHLIVHKNMRQSKSNIFWSKVPHGYIFYDSFADILNKYQRHCENLRCCAKHLGIKLHVGFEVDFFTYDGWLEELKDFVSKLDYDYLISGNHLLFDEKCEDVIDMGNFKDVVTDQSLAQEYFVRHFQTIEESVKSGVFKFIAHIDYARKLCELTCPQNAFIKEKKQIIKTLKDCKIGTEVSTKGLRRIGDFYPCDWLIEEIAKQGVSVVISDDAHNVDELGMDFAKAEAKLKEHNITNRLHF